MSQTFSVCIANQYGVDVAIIASILKTLEISPSSEILLKEKTTLAIYKLAPYWSVTKIKSLLKKVEGMSFE